MSAWSRRSGTNHLRSGLATELVAGGWPVLHLRGHRRRPPVPMGTRPLILDVNQDVFQLPIRTKGIIIYDGEIGGATEEKAA